MSRAKRLAISVAIAAPIFAFLIEPLFPQQEFRRGYCIPFGNPTGLWATLTTVGVFGSVLSVWGIVQFLNRCDDPRHAKRPADPP
jgi:hypothetical protein